MNKIELYDYQEEMIGRIVDAFKSHRSVMVQMPTGTGKTVVLASLIVKSEETTFDGRSESQRRLKNSDAVVWIVAHRRELVEQIEDTVASFSAVDTEHTEDSRIKVYSIQWLTRHLDEITEEPSLVVIDEAHHALAKTYKVLWERFPKAKFMGLTATPYRLNRKGFTDLFDVLVCSHSVPEFIQMGRLSPFDYVSIRPDSKAQVLIDSLKKRGADGDYQTKEMDEILNKRPSIEQLYQSIVQYAKGKKGIVYAISIAHAEHIAKFYQSNGLRAVTICSHTHSKERRDLIDEFRSGNLDILINVDIFSEGFDCPDVEFIQLARPTLSLAKYLQMVGRGLRAHKTKECCTIIDNVGLYKRFGLPTQRWDWQRFFEGKASPPSPLQGEGRKMLSGALSSMPNNVNNKGDYSPLLARGTGGEALYLVVSRDSLLEALGEMSDEQRYEREKAELLSGRYGRVMNLGTGTDLVLCVTPERKRFFVDLRNMNRFEEKKGATVPTRLKICGYELVRYGDTLYSRTRLVQTIPYDVPDPNRFVEGSTFLAFDLRKNLPNAPILPKRYSKYNMTGSEICCFIKHNDTEVFRLIVALYTDKLHDSIAIIVRNSKGDYWLKCGPTWKEVCRRDLSQEETTHILMQTIEDTIWNIEKPETQMRCLKGSVPLSSSMQDVYKPFMRDGRWGVRTDKHGVYSEIKFKAIEPAPFDYYLIKGENDLWGVLYGDDVLVDPNYKQIEIMGRHWARVKTRKGEWEEIDIKNSWFFLWET